MAVVSMTAVAGLAEGQVLVDNKNLNDEKDLQYIQFMYYIDKARARPVYMIDYGITDEKPFKTQKLSVDQTEITGQMSPVLILNKLYKAGWEYMGDETYVEVPMMENWYSYTLKRKQRNVGTD
jgi:hypothetical protein